MWVQRDALYFATGQGGGVDVNVGWNDVGGVVDVVDHGVVCLDVSVVRVLVILNVALGVAAVIFL